jgi:hypothetical protein
MPIQALAVSSLALAVLAPPTSVAEPAVSQAQIWQVAVGLSAGVVYRMDSMPARLHQPGAEFLQETRQLAGQLGLPLPDHSVLKGPEADTVEAMGYLIGGKGHPTAQFLEQRKGHPAAALFQFGMLTHLAMTAVVPGSENAKGIADMVEDAARDSGIARETWSGFVDALRSGKTPVAAKDAMADMIKAVGRACAR